MSSRDAEEEITADVCLGLLSDARRRTVLLSIYDRADDDPIPIEETVAGPMPEAVEMGLDHNHLPKLQAHGVIRWDRDSGTVAEGPAFDDIEPFIDRLDDDRERLPNDWRSGRDR